MSDNEAYLGAADYAVLAVMLAISSAIGVYFRLTGGKQRTIDEYLLGGRSMSYVPVAFSLMASFMSAITLLGVSQENYTYGTQFSLINFGYIAGTPIAAYLFIPVIFRLQNPSVYFYLERRFGSVTRVLSSLAFSVQMILYMGVAIHAPSLTLSIVTGLSYPASVLSVGLVCTFYSTMGGMKAVLITDVFQSLLMFASVLLVVIGGTIKVGGLGVAMDMAYEGGRIQFDEISPDPTVRHTIWSQIIGGTFVFLSIYVANQAQMQRLLSVKSLKQSQLALWLQWPIMMVLSCTTCLSGLVLYAYYRGCDPKADGRITANDQLLPLFVVETMNDTPGLAGLFIAGIFSGSLSTVSSAINSLAATTFEDYLKPLARWAKPSGTMLDSRPTWIVQLLALFYGLVCVGFTFLAREIGSGLLQTALSIFGLVGGPLLGVFTLGMFFPMANEIGASSGLLTALAFCFWIGFGKPKPPIPTLPVSTENCAASDDKTVMSTSALAEVVKVGLMSGEEEPTEYFYLYRISYAWYALIGFLVTMIVGLTVSCLFRGRYKDLVVDPDLFIDPVRRRMKKSPVKDTAGTPTVVTVQGDSSGPKSEETATEAPQT